MTIASHFERRRDGILDRWIQGLRKEFPQYCDSLPQVRYQGAESLRALVASMRARVKDRDSSLLPSIAEMGREIATQNLGAGFSIRETLGALALFRAVVLEEFKAVLRGRLWVALPGDVLAAQECINGAIDVQMLAVAQAYLDVRDAMLRENGRELEAMNERLLRLHDLSCTVAASLNTAEVLDSIVEAVTMLLDAQMAAIALVDGKTGCLTIDLSCGQRGLAEERVEQFVIAAAKVSGMQVVVSGRSQPAQNAGGGLACGDGGLSGIQSLLCAPLQAQGRMLGMIYAADGRLGHFDARCAMLLSTLANHAAVALDNARLYEETKERGEVLAALVQEMHHRIKNNLQTVADLLTLQGYQQGCGNATKCIGDSIGRVKSIAAVHELLNADSAGRTDVKRLAERLVDILRRGQMEGSARTRLAVRGKNVDISWRQATNFALVLHELLHNAIDHAFPDGRDGEVVVDIQEDGGDVVVVVEDTGVGLNEGIDVLRTKGLGLAIAVNLVEKGLMGRITFDESSGSGTKATIRFGKCDGVSCLARDDMLIMRDCDQRVRAYG